MRLMPARRFHVEIEKEKKGKNLKYLISRLQLY